MDDQLSYLLENLASKDTQKYADTINLLIMMGEEALPWLIGALEMTKYSSVWDRIIIVIRKIGDKYPVDDAIPVLLGFLRDPNKSIYSVAYEALLTMKDKVIYNARDILKYYWSDTLWIQGVCALLTKMNSKHMDILSPELIHLIQIGTAENSLDESVMELIGKIGSPKADSVIPILQNKIQIRERENLRLASILVLRNFDSSVTRPLIPILRECLADSSDEIRNSAQQILDGLE